MALSSAFVSAHIAKWEAALDQIYQHYRRQWPRYLFHHAPLDNAVRILRDGNLRSRNDLQSNSDFTDVAAPGVIDARSHAHQSARLYFRPRTPTQWHIEGIRKQNECTYSAATHAPVLVMFVFDATSVLELPSTMFCDRNMQLSSACPGNDEAYFSQIPFTKVYHVGGTGGDKSITEHRCAEVLAPSPLPLDSHLKQIYCRTAAERATLLYLLGDKAAEWAPKISISNDLQLFERRFTFVNEVTLSNEAIVWELNGRLDAQKIEIKLDVYDRNNNSIIAYANNNMDARPSAPSTKWRIGRSIPDGEYLVSIYLEGHLAYQNKIALIKNLF
ncbi:MAG TPA: DarT ssDNA thymidine ADP-ribosyltransferase family protein [Beijerinckiaceae bacterium]|jgi:hypothetical protein|nr:DarT ssDNA thymidine ADP-ribosyltransferase family protein [Beijerinckiaceae bacterium]